MWEDIGWCHVDVSWPAQLFSLLSVCPATVWETEVCRCCWMFCLVSATSKKSSKTHLIGSLTCFCVIMLWSCVWTRFPCLTCGLVLLCVCFSVSVTMGLTWRAWQRWPKLWARTSVWVKLTSGRWMRSERWSSVGVGECGSVCNRNRNFNCDCWCYSDEGGKQVMMKFRSDRR